MLIPRSRVDQSAFTLIESLVAAAIITVTATSVYYAFMRMNDFAAASRCDTAAKVVLERAVNLAQTSDWRYSTPPILMPCADFKTFDLDSGLDSDGQVSLFTDPLRNAVINGTISRRVTQFPVPPDKVGDKPLGDLCRVVFKLEFKLHKRADEPMTTVYSYTLRTSDK